MSTPVEHKLPQRSATVSSSLTRNTSVSDDEAIPDTDSSETTNLLLERLQAWKHMCGNLEDYVSTTAKIAKSQSKDHEKILKTVSEPLKEGNHFSSSEGGVNSLFETMRNKSQEMINMHLETEQNLKGSVLPTLERLHKEIKNKSKELKSGAVKGAKVVEKARQATQKHIELLGQHTASHAAAVHNKMETQHDPYVLRRGINHRLNKQVAEENNHRNDILAIQNSFAQFEAHVLQTIQGVFDQFFQFMGGQLDRQRSMYTEILGTAQRIPADFEWMNFCMTNDAKLVNPDSPPRSVSSITYPNMDHPATQPLIEGSLERRSRAMIKGYSTGYYVVTPARYLHEFKDNDDFRKDPTPELSLYLPDCVIGAIDGAKFNVKGKDVSSGKVGNAFHTNTELSFKAHSPNDAEKWWTVIKNCTRGTTVATSAAAAGAATSPVSPVATSPAATNPADAGVAASTSQAQPPVYAEKEKEAAVASSSAAPAAPAAAAAPAAVPAAEKSVDAKDHAASPTPGLNRTTSTASHFHGAPGGSAVQENL
ncbi:Cytoskeletal signaling protein slm1 [Penicillium rolfsii]|nr:Cytoskeletal signaling protein slm1 [Penicillium rolfsii]